MYEEINDVRLAQHVLGKGEYIESIVSGGTKGIVAKIEATTGVEIKELQKYFEVYKIIPNGKTLEIVMRRL